MQIIQYKSAKNLSFCGKSTMSMFIRFSFECFAMHYNFAIYMYACTCYL